MKLKIPILLFLLALFLNVYGIWWGLPNYYNWSTDDLTPTTPLLIAKNMFKINSRYPIFHYVLLDVFYAPYLGYLYLTGKLVNPHRGFPYGFTDPLTSLTVLSVITRLISAIMGAFAVVFIYLTAKILYGKKAALFSALTIAFSYIFILFSHSGNLDIPYIFWFTIALYSYAKLIKTYKTKYYILLGIFTALAISTKDQIVGFFLLLPIPLLYLHLKHHLKEYRLKSSILNKKLLYCLIALFFTYILFNNLLIDLSGFKYRLNIWLGGEIINRYAEFPNTFLGQLHLFQDTIFKLKYSVGIALFLLLLIGLIYCLYEFDDYILAFLIPLISYYIFDIAMIHYVYYRMTMPLIIILSFFSGKFLSDLIKEVNAKKFLYTIIILIFGYSFFYGFSADLTLVYDSRHSAEDWMIENIDKNAKIEVYQNEQFLPRFHAFGFRNVFMIFFPPYSEDWVMNGKIKPPQLLFKPVLDSPNLESLKIRNPDYIVLHGCINDYINSPPEAKNYIRLLLSEKTDYKIIKIFDNKIPFAPESSIPKNISFIPENLRDLCKRTNRINKPVIILKKENL